MNEYILTSFTECSLTFSNEKTAQKHANKFNLQVCKVYMLDEHTPKLIGYGLENENGLMNGNEFYVCDKTWKPKTK